MSTDITEVIDQVMCGICYDEIDISQLTWNNCMNQSKHHFCDECVKKYVENEISILHFNNMGKIKCPCPDKCVAHFEDEDVQHFAPSTFSRYKLFSNRRIVESNPNSFFCPNPNCINVNIGGTVLHKTNSCMEFRVTCGECGTKACVKCGQTHSILVSCESNIGNEFNTWKYSTNEGCKRCPQCMMYIEKNEGCNHMTCSKCSHQVPFIVLELL
jgi:hypothetical protein